MAAASTSSFLSPEEAGRASLLTSATWIVSKAEARIRELLATVEKVRPPVAPPARRAAACRLSAAHAVAKQSA